MCGHIGLMGKLLSIDEAKLEDGFQACAVRGDDSLGMAIIPRLKAEAPYINKRIGGPPVWVSIPKGGATAVIGHTRSATVGSVTRDNAHPFQFHNIFGAHNGTLDPGWREILQEGTNEHFGTDSEAIFYNFAYNGVEETIKRIRGAWALVWWDEDDGTLNMLRNDKRPMWLATGTGGMMYWASEYWMFQAMVRTGQLDRDTFAKDAEGYAFRALPENIWRRWKLNEKGEVVQLDDTPLEGTAPLPLPPVVKPPEKVGGSGTGASADDDIVYEYVEWKDGDWHPVPADKVAITSCIKFPVGKVQSKKSPSQQQAFDNLNGGRIYRNVGGVDYICKPGQPEITWQELIEKSDGCCIQCGTIVRDHKEIGYLADDYSWLSCAVCTKDWVENDWRADWERPADDFAGSEMVTMGTPPFEADADLAGEEVGHPDITKLMALIDDLDPTQDDPFPDQHKLNLALPKDSPYRDADDLNDRLPPALAPKYDGVNKGAAGPKPGRWGVFNVKTGEKIGGTGCTSEFQCLAYIAEFAMEGDWEARMVQPKVARPSTRSLAKKAKEAQRPAAKLSCPPTSDWPQKKKWILTLVSDNRGQ